MDKGTALRGVRVVELDGSLATRLAGMLLADHGADVTRLVRTDRTRSSAWADGVLDRGKETLRLDFERPQDRARATELLRSADVVIEGMTRAESSDLHLGHRDLRALNPRVIHCSLPAFAAPDPRCDLRACEGLVAAAAGLYLPERRRTGGPRFIPMPVVSLAASVLAATAAVAALVARTDSTAGRHVEVALFDAAFQLVGSQAVRSFDPRASMPVPITPWIGVYRCADGRWLQLHLTPRFIPLFIESLGLSDWARDGLADRFGVFASPERTRDLKARLTALMQTRPAEEWATIVASLSSSAAVCNDYGEWLRHPQAIAGGCVVLDGEIQPGIAPRLRHVGECPSSIPSAPVSNARPLHGTAVLDATIVVAGPTATRVLAELGADVVRIDQANRDIRLAYHADVNRGKRSTMLDLKDPAVVDLAVQLAASSDVFVENFSSGVAERLGLGAERLRRSAPHLVYASLDTYGSGPWRTRRGWDDIAQASVGTMLRHTRSGIPALQSFLFNDYLGGLYLAFGIVLALHQRKRFGVVNDVETSLAYVATISEILGRMRAEGATRPHLGRGPLERIYAAQDGWIFLEAMPDQEAGVVSSIGNLDRSTDLETALERRLADASVEHWTERLAERGVAAHRVRGVDEALFDRAAIEREVVAGTGDGRRGARTIGASMRIDDVPMRAHAAPRMGAHTREVVAGIAGPERAEEMIRRGVACEDPPLPEATALPHFLAWWAERIPNAIAFTQLDAHGTQIRSITFRELQAAVLTATRRLLAATSPGGRALLCPSSTLDFAIGALSCLSAGVAAVPVPPPSAQRTTAWPEIQTFARHAGVTAVVLGQHDAAAWQAAPSSIRDLTVVAVSADDFASAGEALRPGLHERDLAFVQYTSGSTRAPKGVAIDNGSLLEMCERVRHMCRVTRGSVVVNWSPTYHVTGLMLAMCTPLYVGCQAVLLPTEGFAADPTRWLRAISDYSGTHSGGPTFAYEQCVRSTSAVEGIDLSSWQLAFLSAEPIRADVLERFARRFAPHGFDASSFQACYGQTEAVRVAASRFGTAPPVLRVASEALREGRAEPILGTETRAVTALVGHGPLVHEDNRIEIVDPATRRPQPRFRVGEIWISGRGMASGYLDDESRTAESFGGVLADSETPRPRFLRTGDLGFTDGRDLYIVGRATEMMIIRGRNIHPEDIEQTTETAHASVLRGAVAAFASTEQGIESVVVLAELAADAVVAEVHMQIVEAITRRHGVRPNHVGLFARGALPRMASGKLSRRKCREQYEAGSLAALTPVRPARNTSEDVVPLTSVERTVQRIWTRVFQMSEPIPVDKTFFELGGDSLTAIQIVSELQAAGVHVTAAQLDATPTIRAIAGAVERQREGLKGSTSAAPTSSTLALLPTQARVLRTYGRMLAAEAGQAQKLFYVTIPKVFALDHRVDAAVAKRAAVALVRTHQALRCCFAQQAGAWTARACADPEVVVEAHESSLSSEECEDFVADLCARQIAEWDVGEGPLVRFLVCNFRDAGVIVMTTHHLASDNVSERILAEDYMRAYLQARDGSEPALPLPPTELRAWAEHLDAAWRRTDERERQRSPLVGTRRRVAMSDDARATTSLELELTGDDIARAGRAKGASTFDLCCAAFLQNIAETAPLGTRVDIAHHGRPVSEAFDLSRTVGMLFGDVPVAADIPPDLDDEAALDRVKSRLREFVGSQLELALLMSYAEDHLPAELGLNYQRFGLWRPSAPGSPIRLLGTSLWRKVVARLGSHATTFTRQYYGAQTRWFLLDEPGRPLRCSINAPTELSDAAESTRRIRAFESRLKRLVVSAVRGA